MDGPLVIKGITSADDARRALGSGADGIVGSNDGGRQHDGGHASTAVPLGRAWGYGLAAGGEAGVSNAIAVNGHELDVTLALMVVASIDEQRARGRAVIAGANGHLALP